MFTLKFLIRASEVGPAVETDFESLARALFQGSCSPFSFVYGLDLSFRPWTPAHAQPYLRPFVLGRAILPGLLDRIEWVGPNGLRYSVPSRDAFVHAARSGYATAHTPVTVHSTEAWFAAFAHELLPSEQSGGWSVGKVLLTLAAGVATAGVAIYGVQRHQHNHVPVSLRDPTVRAELFDRDEGTCGLCGARVSPARFHLDHQCPKARGGEDIRANLWVTHPTCNQRKGTLTVDEYRARYGSSW